MALAVRGVSYMVDEVPTTAALRDLRAIRDQLHCTAVILIGMDLPKMIAAARHALEIGLDVWLEPHPVNMRHKKVVLNLEVAAAAAETLRLQYPGRVMLVVGCEFSVHLNAGLPGMVEAIRFLMIKYRRPFRVRINRKVNKLLVRLAAAARRHFRGPLTYAAASWEQVDWSRFDYAGINLYRTKNNGAVFEERLRTTLMTVGKPLVITEFGCGSHVGAAQRGPGSFKIVNWFGRHPRIKKGNIRSERVQAAYVGDLIDVWDRNDVHGCFVYTFALRDYPHFAEPLRDLDMASFGLVKFDDSDVTAWEPKQAFHDVARIYARIDSGAPAPLKRE